MDYEKLAISIEEYLKNQKLDASVFYEYTGFYMGGFRIIHCYIQLGASKENPCSKIYYIKSEQIKEIMKILNCEDYIILQSIDLNGGYRIVFKFEIKEEIKWAII